MPLEANTPVPPPVKEEARDSRLAPLPEQEFGPAHSELKEFFIGELKDLLGAERALVAALPKMAAAATSSTLRELFQNHLKETENQVTRLEKAFASIGTMAESVECKGMAGIVAEGEKAMADTPAGSATRDAALILAAQKAEHYEIATYGGLAYLAHVLGFMDAKGLLEATLDEEKGADKMLSLAASSGINRAAVMDGTGAGVAVPTNEDSKRAAAKKGE